MTKQCEKNIKFYQQLSGKCQRLTSNLISQLVLQFRSSTHGHCSRIKVFESQLPLVAYLTFRFARAYGQMNLVEDHFQDVCLYLYQEIDHYNPELGQLNKWTQVVVARYLSKLCKPRSQSKQRIAQMTEHIEDICQKFGDDSGYKSDSWQRKTKDNSLKAERKALLYLLPQLLPKEEWQALSFKADGGSMEELADRTGQAKATWYRRLKQARCNAKAILRMLESINSLSKSS